MITAEEKKQKLWAGLGTGLFHVLLLLLLLTRCSSSGGGDEQQGMIVMDFGNSETGSGNVEANDMGDEQHEAASAPQEATAAQAEEEVLTSTESDVFVPKKNNNKKQEVKKEEIKKEAERTPNPNISKLGEKLNKSNSSKAGGDGDDGKKGNTGDPSGVPDGGSGGNGVGNDGISGIANIKGWKLLNQAKYKEKFTESGRIVLDIIIDDHGNIIDVKKGRGTTSSSNQLFEIAKKRAYELKFSHIGGQYKAYKGSYTVDFEVN